MARKSRKQKEKEARRIQYMVMVGALLLIAVAVVYTIQGSFFQDSWLTIEPANFQNEEIVEVEEAFEEWDAEFGCGREVTIRARTGSPVSSQGETNAEAQPGLVIFFPEVLRQPTDSSFRFVALHEAFHACKPEMSKIEPFFLSNGDQVIGYEGLTPVISTASGQRQFANLCEEGVADLLASVIDHNYAAHPAYAAVAFEVLEIYNGNWHRLVELSQDNDFESFVREMLLLAPETTVTPQHVETLLAACEGWYGQGASTLPR